MRLIQSNSSVIENASKVAISFGPFVYCLEGVDNESNLHLISVSKDVTKASLEEININGVKVTGINMPGKKRIINNDQTLYMDYVEPQYEDVTLKFIPYYTWANRGENEMRVWIN